VDIAGGKVYAPIKDGTKRPDGTRYLHPFIALFDAQTLRFTGEAHELPQALHTEGVPWIAVDARRGSSTPPSGTTRRSSTCSTSRRSRS
jgi:hypothetical protein